MLYKVLTTRVPYSRLRKVSHNSAETGFLKLMLIFAFLRHPLINWIRATRGKPVTPHNNWAKLGSYYRSAAENTVRRPLIGHNERRAM